LPGMLCTCLPAGPSATQIRRAIPGPEDERAQNAPSGSGAVRPTSISPSSLTDIARRYHPLRHKRDRDGRHQAVRDAAAAQVAVTADQCTAPRTRSGRRKQQQCSSNAAEPCPRNAAATSPNSEVANSPLARQMPGSVPDVQSPACKSASRTRFRQPSQGPHRPEATFWAVT
jgi:hypothetical protein